jgi:replication factor C subunit 1
MPMDIRQFFKGGGSSKKNTVKPVSNLMDQVKLVNSGSKKRKESPVHEEESTNTFLESTGNVPIQEREKEPSGRRRSPRKLSKNSPANVVRAEIGFVDGTKEKPIASPNKALDMSLSKKSSKLATSPQKKPSGVVSIANSLPPTAAIGNRNVPSDFSPSPQTRKSPPTSTVSNTKRLKRDPPLEPKLTQSSFNADKAAPECLRGCTFVFSGVLPNLSREDGQEMVKTLGGRITGAVSSLTNYLVVGEELEDGRVYTEGSKYKRAVQEGTHIVQGEEAFYGLLQQYNDKEIAAGNALLNTAPKLSQSEAPLAANPYAKKAPNNPYAKPALSNPYVKAKPYTSGKPSPAEISSPVDIKADRSSGANLLWVDKYKPTRSGEILGNAESVKKLGLWLSSWEQKFNNSKAVGKGVANPNDRFKAALLSGPPGIGSKYRFFLCLFSLAFGYVPDTQPIIYSETTTATIVAKESGRDVIEFNASDVRSKKAIKDDMGDITGSYTLEFGKPAINEKRQSSRIKRCIIMDEVDGMGAGDRSGMSELIQMIKKSRVPIICICNDRQSQKMKSLLPYCMDLRYRRPTKSVIANRAVRIAAQEGFTVEQNAAEAIAESCGNDVRQVLNCMQMWASDSSSESRMTYKDLKQRESSINKDEILRVSLFDAARNILEGRRGLQGADASTERQHFFRRNDAFFVDYNFVGLLVQQNYIKVMQGQFNDAKRSNDQSNILGVLERMSQASDAMSDFAEAENGLRGGQNWSLLPFCAMLAVKTGFHAGGPNGGGLPGFPDFTSWLGRNSSKGKKARLLHELQHHMNYKISGGAQEMRLSYLPVLRDRFLSLLLGREEGLTEKAIDLMDEYGLDRDDVFEKLDEFRMDHKADTFAKLDSKKKAAFTRFYNQGTHRSQALVAEQGGSKTVKRGANAVAEETIDPDAIDDDVAKAEENEGDDADEDMEKIKAMFKKKGRNTTQKAATKGKAKKKK